MGFHAIFERTSNIGFRRNFQFAYLVALGRHPGVEVEGRDRDEVESEVEVEVGPGGGFRRLG